MAEYYAVLKKAVSGMDGNAGDARRTVYDKARNALIGQLKAIDPPLSTSEISRQRLELEEAIRRVERESAAEMQSPRGRGVESVREAVGDMGGPSPQDVFRRAIQEAESRSGGSERSPMPARADNSYGGDRSMRDRIERAPPQMDPYQEPPRGRRPQPQLAPDYEDDWEQTREPAPAAESYSDRRDRQPRQPSRSERGRGGYREEQPREPIGRGARRSRFPAILLTILILALLVGLGAFGWSQRELIMSYIGEQDKSATVTPPPAEGSTPPATVDAQGSSKDADRPGDGAAPSGVRKVDGGTEAPAAPGPVASAESGGEPLVSQKATLYEEPVGGNATAGAGVTVIQATSTWQLAEGPDGPEIVANVEVPDRGLKVKLTIRKNSDAALPASHLVEAVVNVGSVFPGRGIRAIPRLVMKPAEDSRGQALVGASAKVADGLFWIALSSAESDINNNLKGLRENGWIDLPIVYGSGQRAILTLEKGGPGEKVFQTAMSAWGQGG